MKIKEKYFIKSEIKMIKLKTIERKKNLESIIKTRRFLTSKNIFRPIN